ncbi:hypothetical protein OG225_42995 (plasmid) [Nocardia sp. NBC_01377]|uniref:hypothetical protein n=1 Tax=Nocardia sp. NBC_01377 TaxID=2903595 RepID=UPI0032551CD7
MTTNGSDLQIGAVDISAAFQVVGLLAPSGPTTEMKGESVMCHPQRDSISAHHTGSQRVPAALAGPNANDVGGPSVVPFAQPGGPDPAAIAAACGSCEHSANASATPSDTKPEQIGSSAESEREPDRGALVLLALVPMVLLFIGVLALAHVDIDILSAVSMSAVTVVGAIVVLVYRRRVRRGRGRKAVGVVADAAIAVGGIVKSALTQDNTTSGQE